MNGATTIHGLDFLVFGAPLIFFLVVAFFRLDNLLVSSKATRVAVRPLARRDRDFMFTDPDGRPWE